MITLYSHAAGPNGWKVAIVLEQLGLEYETKYLDFGTQEHKAPEYTKFNPNGRIPTIIDHDNNDFVLWESIAIIQYLVDRYDKDNKFHYPAGTAEGYQTLQWMLFQVSGQGPYFGQAAWFGHLHPERIPSATERYQKEIERVISVLDGVLANKKYLVGDKITIADTAFITWDKMLPWLMEGSSIDLTKYKNFQRWHNEVTSLPSVKKVYEIKDGLSKK